MTRKTLEQKQRSARFYGNYLPAAILLTVIFGMFYLIAVMAIR